MSRRPAAIRVGPGTIPRRRRRQRHPWRLAILLVPAVVAGAVVAFGQLDVGQSAGSPPAPDTAAAPPTAAPTPSPTVPPTATPEPTATARVASPPSPEETTTPAASPAEASTALPSPSPIATLIPAATAAATAVPTVIVSPGPATTPGTDSGRIYVVKSGDRLKDIAARFGVSFWDIAELNGLTNPDSLSVGQVLRIPDPS